MSGTDLVLPNGSTVAINDRRSAATLELRDPKGATSRVGWTSPTMPQVDEWNAEQAFRLGVLANVIAYRCVQLRARASASVPLVAGRRMGDASTINENAPITRLLGPPPGGPAPGLSAYKLLRWTFAQKIVTGRRAWEIETAQGSDVPVAFWPLAAASLRATPSQSGTEWFRLFEYGSHHDPIKFQPDEVFYGWEPSGVNFRQPESELQSARYDLSLVTMCDRYSLGFLKNNAVPAAVITTTAFPNEAARRKFLQNWSADFGGPDNAGRVALNEVADDGDGPVGDSIDVKVLGLSAKDARLIEQRRDIMQEIAIALGTPWSKLDASGRTFDNAEQEDHDWWENTILPDLIDLQDDINMQLAPRLGDEVVWFDLRHVRALQRRIKPITQTVGAPSLVQAQLMKINEARADYGLEPIEDGDRMMTAEEIMALSGQTPAPATRAIEPGEERGASDAPGNTHPDERGELLTPPASEAPETRIADPEAIEQRRVKIWKATDAVVSALEGRWERAWRKMFNRQADAVVARLTGKRGRQAFGETRDAADPVDVEAIFTRQFWVEEANGLALDLYEETSAAGLSRLAMSFGVSFDISARWVQDFIEARANQLAGQVTATTYDAIQAELVAGVAGGESIDDLATRIRSVFAQASKTRATVIARTEVISAYNGSAVMGASTMPADVVAAQEWIATRDGRTRSAHAEADGQTVAIGTPFNVMGDQLAYPGDPAGRSQNTVQCRCAVAFLTPEEFAAVSAMKSARVERRAARMAVRLTADGEFDEMRFRRTLEMEHAA
jgi:HK97 family phage portal protein